MAIVSEGRYRGIRLRPMSERRCFPFGQPVLPRPPSATGSRTVFVLGAYPSGFHVAWWLPGREDRRTPDAKALIVDNESEVFWDGDGAADLLEQWQREVCFVDHSWGRVALPEAGNNGPSGQWLRDKILVPLGYSRADCWITDCLDTARLNAGQQRRIRETYLPVIGRLGLSTPNMDLTPTGESSIVWEARQGHLGRLSRELDTARPELIVTLGNAALRVLRLLVEIDSGDPGTALAETKYGAEVRARLGARPVRWLPLVHPRSGERIPKWRQIHMRWLERIHDRVPS
jgi:uracil-DNA glycosylase